MNGLARRWFTTLDALHEHPLRVAFARSELYNEPLAQVAAALHAILQRAELAEPAAHAALNAFVPLVIAPEHLPLLALLREAAQLGSLTSLLRLLRCTTAKGHRTAIVSDPEAAIEVKGSGRQLTLGQRRALARKPSRAQLDRLLDDPHPMVVRILLANPRITEDDIVRMAARRPMRADIAVEIGTACTRSRRVRLTLVQNPGAPHAVSVPLLSLLSRPSLKQEARASNLPAVVRATAKELWQLRPPLMGDAQSLEWH